MSRIDEAAKRITEAMMSGLRLTEGLMNAQDARRIFQTYGVEVDGMSKEELKKAFRKLSMQYHPDRNGGEDRDFKLISAAYAALEDVAAPKAGREADMGDTTWSMAGYSGGPHLPSTNIYRNDCPI